MRSLDVRQMRGEPGFFGSYGFQKWAGVGESKPIGVMHELGHSYWGGFPVTGFPDLTWNARPGHDLAPALERYHADILAFMKQPPDGFELFRQRLRNLPELSQDNPEHKNVRNVERELVIFVTPVVFDAESEINQAFLRRREENIQKFKDAIGEPDLHILE